MFKTAAKIQTKNDKVNYQETEPQSFLSGFKKNSDALQGCNNGDRRKVILHSQTWPEEKLSSGLSFFKNGGNQESCQKKSNVRFFKIIRTRKKNQLNKFIQ